MNKRKVRMLTVGATIISLNIPSRHRIGKSMYQYIDTKIIRQHTHYFCINILKRTFPQILQVK